MATPITGNQMRNYIQEKLLSQPEQQNQAQLSQGAQLSTTKEAMLRDYLSLLDSMTPAQLEAERTNIRQEQKLRIMERKVVQPPPAIYGHDPRDTGYPYAGGLRDPGYSHGIMNLPYGQHPADVRQYGGFQADRPFRNQAEADEVGCQHDAHEANRLMMQRDSVVSGGTPHTGASLPTATRPMNPPAHKVVHPAPSGIATEQQFPNKPKLPRFF